MFSVINNCDLSSNWKQTLSPPQQLCTVTQKTLFSPKTRSIWSAHDTIKRTRAEVEGICTTADGAYKDRAAGLAGPLGHQYARSLCAI